MRRKMQNKTPWLSPDRTPKSEKEIKRSCESWSLSTWEDYLKTIEVNQEEVLLDDPVLIEEYPQEAGDTCFILDGKESLVLQRYLLDATKELTFKQRAVLNFLFLGGLNLRETGERLEISAYAVSRIRDRALKSLGMILIKRMTSTKPRKDRPRREREKHAVCF